MKTAYKTAVAVLALAMLLGSCALVAHGESIAIEPLNPGPPTAPLYIEPLPHMRSGIAHEVITWESMPHRGQPKGRRKDNWHEDTRMSSEWRVQHFDYGPFVRFHLAPVRDFVDQELIDQTFCLSNCAPGNSQLNNGPWKQLEREIVNGMTKGAIRYVVTAPLIIPDQTGSVTIQYVGNLRRGGVPVPTHFAKAMMQVRDGKASYIAWVAPNADPKDAVFMDFRESVDFVEIHVAKDLFSWRPKDEQKIMEAVK